jgi:hypothetical protein
LQAAVDALSALLVRDQLVIPDLHLALSAWALDELVPDRAVAPWPDIRSRLTRSTDPYGVGDPIRALTRGLSAERFDAASLVQELLQKVAVSPSPRDACLLLWLLSVSIDKLSPALGSSDSALAVLIARRAGIVNRLVEDVDDDAFLEFTGDPDAADLPIHLGVDEALLADLSLSSRNEQSPWVTYEEARGLFGMEATQARSDATRAKSRWIRTAGWLILALGVDSIAVVALLTRELGFEISRATWVLVATFTTFAAVSMWIFRLDPRPMIGAGRLFVSFTTFGILAWVLAVNSVLPQPVVTDTMGLVIATVLSLVVQLLPVASAREPAHPN